MYISSYAKEQIIAEIKSQEFFWVITMPGHLPTTVHSEDNNLTRTDRHTERIDLVITIYGHKEMLNIKLHL